MGQCCGKIPTEDDVDAIRDSLDQFEAFILSTVIYELTHDLSISDSPDPFKDPVEKQINDKEWITDKGNHVVSWFSSTENQINFKIVSGPDSGVHMFYNYDTHHQGQTGVENFREGHEGERRR
ncbi:MAG TPA: hypothetical protein VF837_05340 [Patescibacteria group bacterium]